MPNTGYFRASSVNITGGSNITGEDNLHSEGTGQFSANIDPGDEIKVELSFTNFFIPENNRVTDIEYVIGGTAETENLALVQTPTLEAGVPTGAGVGTFNTPAPTLMGSNGAITSTTNPQFLPSNHTYTLDALYPNYDSDNPTPGITQVINNINGIIGNNPGRVVNLEITFRSFLGLGTLTLDGTNPGPKVKLTTTEESSKVKIQQQPDIFDGDLIIPGSHTKIKIG